MAKRMREKTLNRQQNSDNRPYACAKFISISPSKVGIVIDTVRGKKVDDAVGILSLLPNNAASVVLKLVNSAVANAEHNKGMNRQNLYVAEIFAGPGPIMKRQMARGKGSASRILKRTSHITVILDEVKE